MSSNCRSRRGLVSTRRTRPACPGTSGCWSSSSSLRQLARTRPQPASLPRTLSAPRHSDGPPMLQAVAFQKCCRILSRALAANRVHHPQPKGASQQIGHRPGAPATSIWTVSPSERCRNSPTPEKYRLRSSIFGLRNQLFVRNFFHSLITRGTAKWCQPPRHCGSLFFPVADEVISKLIPMRHPSYSSEGGSGRTRGDQRT
jgi:hypothetical protein